MRIAVICLCLLAVAGCSGPRTYIVHGTVNDAVTGKPIKDATLMIGGMPSLTTNIDGQFAHIMDHSRLPPKSHWKLQASADGYATESIDIRLLAEAENDDSVYIYVHVYLRPAVSASDLNKLRNGREKDSS